MGLDQTVSLIFLALGVVCGTYIRIDSCGGWPIFRDDLKKHFRRKK